MKGDEIEITVVSLFRDIESILKGLEKRISDVEDWARAHHKREIKSVESMLSIFGTGKK